MAKFQPSRTREPARKLERLFLKECSEGNGFKLEENRFRLDTRRLFAVRVVRHWNRLSRGVVDVPSLAVLKARLDEALRNLVCGKVSLPMAGQLEQVPFQPNLL